MPDWQSRAVSAAQAVRVVHPGHHVVVGSACATPRRLLEALEAAAPVGVQLVHFLTDGPVEYRGGTPASRFRHRTFYIGRDMRALATRAPVDYVPISLGGHRMESRLIDGTFEVRILFGEPPVTEPRADAGEKPARPRAPARPARAAAKPRARS